MDGLPWTVSSEFQRRMIEEASLGLVREFLHRKGLDKTLSTLDEEIPRIAGSICNRTELAQTLHIAPLVRRNKNLLKPFRSVVEMVVWSMLQNPRAGYSSSSRPASAHPAVRPLRNNRTDEVKGPDQTVTYNPHINSMTKQSLKTVESASSAGRSSPKPSIIRKLPAAPEQKKKVTIEEMPPETRQTRTNSFTLKDLEDVDSLEDKCLRWLAGYDQLLHMELMEKSEAESSKSDDEKSPSTSKSKRPRPRLKKIVLKVMKIGLPLDFDTAKRLRRLIFGVKYSRNFNEAWLKQAFTFRDCLDERSNRLRYGIIQKKGGPCALVAVVQGFVLKHVIFGRIGNNGREVRHRNPSVLDVDQELRTNCLVESIMEILWKAGGSHRAVVATLGTNQSFKMTQLYPTDGVTEYIVTTHCDTIEFLHTTIKKHINHFENGYGSAICLLYSVILSRGISEVILDMDDRTNCLLGKSNFCTVELLNLFLVGCASSNMFNEHRVSPDDGAVHRGVTLQSEIGFLTLNVEDSQKIGANLNNPSYPIWIVAGKDSQFSLLFALNRGVADDEIDVFDLHYYEGLSNQGREVKLTVDRTQKTPKVERETTSPLENCIMRRWRKALLGWHVINPTV